MIPRTAPCGQPPATTLAPAPAATPPRSLARVLASPRVRLGAGAAVVAVTALAAVRHRQVSPWEAGAFRAVNGLPSSVYPAAWACMQLGAFGSAPAAAGAAWLAGEHELAARLLASGIGTWALAKLVKQVVRRPRPGALLPGTRCRGRPAAGLGYLSGHAGVAAALGAAALPRLGLGGRAVVLIAVPAVGLTRIYTGAHLPLDIVGGAALGLAVEATVTLVTGRTIGSSPGHGGTGPEPTTGSRGGLPPGSARGPGAKVRRQPPDGHRAGGRRGRMLAAGRGQK